ncbi:unnamed protein product [Pleuronectes platessa]|uniref:Uncharacterized protein n=1 Tax=Pleuronectes platessa TaxID=8262 RepID=A0A9N7TPH8_PLEPL|nr:unnamed protein product [Pleuronectes platessa]
MAEAREEEEEAGSRRRASGRDAGLSFQWPRKKNDHGTAVVPTGIQVSGLENMERLSCTSVCVTKATLSKEVNHKKNPSLCTEAETGGVVRGSDLEHPTRAGQAATEALSSKAVERYINAHSRLLTPTRCKRSCPRLKDGKSSPLSSSGCEAFLRQRQPAGTALEENPPPPHLEIDGAGYFIVFIVFIAGSMKLSTSQCRARVMGRDFASVVKVPQPLPAWKKPTRVERLS